WLKQQVLLFAWPKEKGEVPGFHNTLPPPVDAADKFQRKDKVNMFGNQADLHSIPEAGIGSSSLPPSRVSLRGSRNRSRYLPYLTECS
ncbi:hypothetical protein SK128_025982, partial [Halocaridina rubra]